MLGALQHQDRPSASRRPNWTTAKSVRRAQNTGHCLWRTARRSSSRTRPSRPQTRLTARPRPAPSTCRSTLRSWIWSRRAARPLLARAERHARSTIFPSGARPAPRIISTLPTGAHAHNAIRASSRTTRRASASSATATMSTLWRESAFNAPAARSRRGNQASVPAPRRAQACTAAPEATSAPRKRSSA